MWVAEALGARQSCTAPTPQPTLPPVFLCTTAESPDPPNRGGVTHSPSCVLEAGVLEAVLSG